VYELVSPGMDPRAGQIRRTGTEDPRMSQIVDHGGVVYLSGQVAADVKEQCIKAQTKSALAKVGVPPGTGRAGG
jgi:enamine deaminase RidA (YjgF/YER057c/UK114 family)